MKPVLDEPRTVCAGKSGGRLNGKRRMKIARFHRVLGALSAVFLLLLAVTGPLMQHGDALGLSEKWVKSPALLWFYDLEPSRLSKAVRTEAGWVVWQDGALLLDRIPVLHDAAALVGAASSGDTIAAVSATEIVLLDREGAIVERMGREALPGVIAKAGVAPDGGVVVETDAGIFKADRDLLSWLPAGDADIAWRAPTEDAPLELRQAADDAWRGHQVSYFRLVADIHSGRYLGPLGPYTMDLAALALLILIISGFVNWWRLRKLLNNGNGGKPHHR